MTKSNFKARNTIRYKVVWYSDLYKSDWMLHIGISGHVSHDLHLVRLSSTQNCNAA